MESEVKFSANELALLFFTYFSTQCAAVMAQFSLNNAAPQLWMYLPVSKKKLRQFIDFVVWIHNFLNSISIKGEIAVFGFEIQKFSWVWTQKKSTSKSGFELNSAIAD